MNKVLTPTLFVLVLLVIGFGLSYTLYKNLLVAPEIQDATQGRLHAHAKNVTWLGGTPEQVSANVAEAVLPGQANLLATLPTPWQRRIQALTPEPSADSDYLVLLPDEGADALTWALPGAYWAVYARAPVIFAGKERISDADRAIIEALEKPIYVLAPPHLIGANVVQQLAAQVPVQRIAGITPERHTLRLARYRNPISGFGWGRIYSERYGYFHYVLASATDPQSALAALPLAYTNATTLIYGSSDGGFTPTVDAYLWEQRTDWFVTPAEGPFRHFWIAGDGISYSALARADLAIEKADFPGRGPAGLGPLEAIVIVFIALGIASGIFVFSHSLRYLPDIMLGMRLAWTGTALLLPVLGIYLYLAANDPYAETRTQAQRTAAATAMGFGYGAPLMIVIAYAFVWFGMPNFFRGDWTISIFFLLGSGMVLMMIGMYVFAVVIAALMAQFPMRAMMKSDMAKAAVFGESLKVTALSMAAVSLGMMSLSWWTFKYHLPMMPKEDEILWFGVMWLASFIGFLVAWPLNWPMIVNKLKPGTM